MPGSVALYAPGKATKGPGVPDPPPLTLICAHETKNWAPLKVGRVVDSEVFDAQQIGPGRNGARNGELVLRGTWQSDWYQSNRNAVRAGQQRDWDCTYPAGAS